MGRVRLTRESRARLAYAVGVLLIAVGLALVLSIGWGLIVAGVGAVAGSVLLYDVTEPEPRRRGLP